MALGPNPPRSANLPAPAPRGERDTRVTRRYALSLRGAGAAALREGETLRAGSCDDLVGSVEPVVSDDVVVVERDEVVLRVGVGRSGTVRDVRASRGASLRSRLSDAGGGANRILITVAPARG